MKNLSLINNIWIERINPNITSEERAILDDNSISYSAKKTLIESIHARSKQSVNQEDSETAQAIYDQHKLNDATIISADIFLPDGHGIINCRVAGQHKQIRF